jgi:hypothetical protein
MAVVAAEIFGVAGLGQRMMQASTLLATEMARARPRIPIRPAIAASGSGGQ